MPLDKVTTDLLNGIAQNPLEFDRYLILADRLEELASAAYATTYRQMGKLHLCPAYRGNQKYRWVWFRESVVSSLPNRLLAIASQPDCRSVLPGWIYDAPVEGDRLPHVLVRGEYVTFLRWGHAVHWFHEKLCVLRAVSGSTLPT